MSRTLITMILVAISGVAAIGAETPAPGQAPRVSVSLQNAPLPDALKRIQEASGLRLAFAQEVLKDATPVTLSAKNEPVDDVLLKILRPRGMECVYTGEKMAAIVRADSSFGAAKMAGRAIRSLARLTRKIESARQVSDEIVMPEWTDEDDRTLAEG